MEEIRNVPPSGDALETAGVDSADWEFCWKRLLEVSRTFSKPIGMLPESLRTATTCGYLLCRVADTIEDHPTLPFDQKRDLFQRFLGVVEDGNRAERFTEAFADVPGEGAYFVLAEGLDRVVAVFRALPKPVQRPMQRRVGEMSRGMLTYEKRRDWGDGVAEIANLRDLERYCYYVAGTVGHLLTELFIWEMHPVDKGRRQQLRRNAEQFGLGLQMVNILKDQTDDREEGWCFIPRDLLSEQGLDPESLFEEDNREAAHRAVQPVFERASDHLDCALQYILAIPSERREIRTSWLVPLWLAVRTLVHARGNDAMFEPGAPVKISREEVAKLAADCREHATEDGYLRERYQELYRASSV